MDSKCVDSGGNGFRVLPFQGEQRVLRSTFKESFENIECRSLRLLQ